jgi:hypothetical protein
VQDFAKKYILTFKGVNPVEYVKYLPFYSPYKKGAKIASPSRLLKKYC